MANNDTSPMADVNGPRARKRPLTTTSYAILGLLSVQPWSAYELTKQMRRSLRFHWPRAQSRVYQEAPNLVAHGAARARQEATGARARTVYTISAKGRRALADWLGQPSAPPTVEAEALLRSLFADVGTKHQLLATLNGLRDEALEMRAELLEQGTGYLDTGGPFPERLHIIALNGRFSLSFTKMLAEWAEWAAGEVANWSDVGPLSADDDPQQVFGRVIGDELLAELRDQAAGPRQTR